MNIVMTVLLLAAIAVFVGSPLSGERLAVERPTGQRRKRLEEIKRSNYRALKDIEEELATGRLTEQDYQQLRAHYVEEAARAIQELDRLDGAD